MHTTMYWLTALAWVSIALRAAGAIYVNRDLRKCLGRGLAYDYASVGVFVGWHVVSALAVTIVAVTLP